MERPEISFVVAAYNAAATLEAAVASALAQKGVAVEVIVVDDCSSDATAVLAGILAERDARVKFLRQLRNGGVAAARNRALEAARGAWVAILDADDLVVPERCAALLALAHRERCDIVADNVERFLDHNPQAVWPLLPRDDDDRVFAVSLPDYLQRNRMTGGDANLGYLKPLFSRSFLQAHGIRYDARLRIGEDFHLALQALAAGARFAVTTRPYYRYRVLQQSLSHSLRSEDLQALLSATEAVLAGRLADRSVRAAHDAFGNSVADLLAFSDFRTKVRQGEWLPALRSAVAPRLWLTIPRMATHAYRRRRDHRRPTV